MRIQVTGMVSHSLRWIPTIERGLALLPIGFHSGRRTDRLAGSWICIEDKPILALFHTCGKICLSPDFRSGNLNIASLPSGQIPSAVISGPNGSKVKAQGKIAEDFSNYAALIIDGNRINYSKFVIRCGLVLRFAITVTYY
jgi:hypothetical protein